MKPQPFTLAQDKALFTAISALPTAKIIALLLFIVLIGKPDRQQFVDYLKQVSS